MKEIIKQYLQPLNLPPEAEGWLLDTWEVFQGLDDWRDGDKESPDQIERVIYLCLCGMPGNGFFHVHAHRLLPLLSNVVLKWFGANKVEEEKIEEQYPKSYMWRAGYYDLILETVAICHGFEAARSATVYVMSLYGETLEDYKKEFGNA